MKRILLFVFTLFITTAMFAQTRASFINESFDGSEFPEGWTIAGSGSNSWSIEASTNAGGSPNELMLYYNPSFNGISRVVMNPVDLTGVDDVVVSFRHYLDNYSYSSIIGIATSSDGGTTWNTGWQQEYSMTGGAFINETITTPDMGKDNVLFCLFFEGDSYNITRWCFDDFDIFSQEELDLKVVSIDIPEIIPADETEIYFTVQNVGKTSINLFDVEVNVSGWDEPVVATIDQALVPFEKRQISFSNFSNVTLLANPQDSYYHISVEIVNVDGVADDDATNNKVEKNVFAAWGDTQRTTMIEHFTSSTCGPCVAVNYTMNQLTNANPGKYTYTKYQMSWPSPGDPYYTEEGNTRRKFYGCDAVPTVFFNGSYVSATIVQEMLDIENSAPAYVNIRGAFNVEGNTINVIADIMSYVKLENVSAYISVNEKVTTGNVGNNGETEFHHVMMKMLENADGNTISIEPGKYQRLEFSYDMSSTNVEEMSDLEVAIWVQNPNNKEVFNSKFAYENTEHRHPVRNLVETTSAKGTRTFSWDAPEQGTPTGYKVYVDGTLAAGNTTETSVSYDTGKQVVLVEVIALYEGGKTSVGVVEKFNKEDVNTTENEMTSNVSIYPNPAKDVVKISAIEGQASVVRIYNVMGMMVDEVEVNSDNMEINISDYTPGIYFFNVEGEVVKVIKN
ncbi:MAG: T9SS type A sorting domain-containing protein [Bacteroidales bacterium]|nr:T9SS type A sorting domain-containing protein [Bacteroidales bacterium]